MSRRQKFVLLIIAMVMIAGLGLAWVPFYWTKNLPAILAQEFSPVLSVGQAEFHYGPPRLILTDIRLANPPAFGPGNAVKIGRIEVLFAGYGIDPVAIDTITVHEVKGRLVLRGIEDNFAALYQIMMNKKQETPHGMMARSATLQKVLLRAVTTQNEDGSIMLPMADSALETIISRETPVPVRNIAADVFGAVLGQQSQASPALTVKSATDKAVDIIKSIGKAVQDYITSP